MEFAQNFARVAQAAQSQMQQRFPPPVVCAEYPLEYEGAKRNKPQAIPVQLVQPQQKVMLMDLRTVGKVVLVVAVVGFAIGYMGGAGYVSALFGCGKGKSSSAAVELAAAPVVEPPAKLD